MKAFYIRVITSMSIYPLHFYYILKKLEQQRIKYDYVYIKK